jgi:transcriptional regulator with XRE-family HTH domain
MIVPARTWTVRSTEDLGRAIADIRHERGMTQEDLAQDGGLSRSWLAKIETGRTSPQVLNHALRLLRRLGATVTVTFEGIDRG